MKSEQKDMSPPSSDTGIRITDETLSVSLSDGRTIAAPLTWFPRLMDASPEERENRRFIGKGEGIHWPDLDEDIQHQRVDRRQAIGGKSTLIEKMA